MKQSKVTTAVVLASGHGTRRLPMTLVVQKEMTPILDRPTIDYVVADCVAAGIKRIIFVVQPNVLQIYDYYTQNPYLPQQYKDVSFEFAERITSLHGEGTAAACRAATHLLEKDEVFVVVAGDNFLFGPKPSYVAELIKEFNNSPDADMALLATKCDRKNLSRYGVIGEAPDLIVEKPTPEKAPSEFINVSHYLFTSKVLHYLDNLEPVNDEYRLTDAIDKLVKEGGKAVVVKTLAKFLDIGNVDGWLEANKTIGAEREKRVLVVGGDGFIGRRVCAGQTWDVTDLKHGSDVRNGIIGDYSTIIFLATDISQTQEAYNYNVSLFEALDRYMQTHPDTHVIYSSSAAVYADKTTEQIELSIPEPPTIYGRSKLIGEVYVQRYKKHTIFRFSNVYGDGDGNGVVDQFVRGIEPLTNDETQVRDYVPVEKVVECIRDAVSDPDRWYGITNVSSNTGMTVKQVWQMVKGDEPFKSKATRKGDVSYSVLDNTKMKDLLGGL
jgi:UTP--glucose-1-phosphate uridylyltransferase